MLSKLTCPACNSEEVAVTAEQMFMVNTGDHYCHSMKTQDSDAKATCLSCQWRGARHQLIEQEDAAQAAAKGEIAS